MAKISNVEKGAFMKLFNRGGYVLDFVTPDFDAFTLDSIGVALCSKYQLSKGKSLMAYINEANEADVIKLFSDLLEYYETEYINEIKSDANLYKKCREIMDRINPKGLINSSIAENLKDKFSSAYISTQIDLMLQMQKQNPTEAIGKAKELIESCCKTILELSDIEHDKKWDIVKLVDETTKLLKVTPKYITDETSEYGAIKAILGNLKAIAANVAQLRNSYGSGHGKGANYKGLEERHAKLAIGSSMTLVNFLWDSYERQITSN